MTVLKKERCWGECLFNSSNILYCEISDEKIGTLGNPIFMSEHAICMTIRDHLQL